MRADLEKARQLWTVEADPKGAMTGSVCLQHPALRVGAARVWRNSVLLGYSALPIHHTLLPQSLHHHGIQIDM